MITLPRIFSTVNLLEHSQESFGTFRGILSKMSWNLLEHSPESINDSIVRNVKLTTFPGILVHLPRNPSITHIPLSIPVFLVLQIAQERLLWSQYLLLKSSKLLRLY